MDSIHPNHQINMTSEYSVSKNKSFEKPWNTKSFSMFCVYSTSCVRKCDSVSMSVPMHKVNMNSDTRENRKESSISTISTEALFDNDSNKARLNLNQVLLTVILNGI